MRINASTAKYCKINKKKVSSNQLYEPETNIEIGVSYLSRLLKRYDGRIEYVLAAYNAVLLIWINGEIVFLKINDAFCDYMPF